MCVIRFGVFDDAKGIFACVDSNGIGIDGEERDVTHQSEQV